MSSPSPSRSARQTDLALYLDYYAMDDQRADMDRSGTITTADYGIYTDEYAKR